MRSLGHTCTGTCICTLEEHQGVEELVWNPGCPVAGHTEEVISVAFSPEGKLFISGSRDRLAKIWNTETWAEVSILECGR